MAAIHYKPGKFRYTQTFSLERQCEDKQPHGGMVNSNRETQRILVSGRCDKEGPLLGLSVTVHLLKLRLHDLSIQNS